MLLILAPHVIIQGVLGEVIDEFLLGKGLSPELLERAASRFIHELAAISSTECIVSTGSLLETLRGFLVHYLK